MVYDSSSLETEILLRVESVPADFIWEKDGGKRDMGTENRGFSLQLVQLCGSGSGRH
jgi:hypothetical protein